MKRICPDCRRKVVIEIITAGIFAVIAVLVFTIACQVVQKLDWRIPLAGYTAIALLFGGKSYRIITICWQHGGECPDSHRLLEELAYCSAPERCTARKIAGLMLTNNTYLAEVREVTGCRKVNEEVRRLEAKGILERDIPTGMLECIRFADHAVELAARKIPQDQDAAGKTVVSRGAPVLGHI